MDKFKQASSSLTDRLKTGSAQMSRLVTTKMKDLLNSPTPESKLVDDATSAHLESPDWGANLRICAMIGSEEISGAEVVRAIKRKIGSGKSVVLSLDLLEACTSNCEKVFSEVASEKVLEEMIRVVEDGKMEDEVRVKAMRLIKAWGELTELNYLPVFRQTYVNLKTREITPMQNEDFPSTQYSLESLMDQPHMTPQENYPFPDSAVHGADNTIFSYNYGSQSVEEKKEVLEITRNSLDILFSILNSGAELKPKDDLTLSMLEKCKQSLAAVQMIAESTTNDDVMLFEALNLHNQLQQIISKFDEMDVAPVISLDSEATPLENSDSAENLSVGKQKSDSGATPLKNTDSTEDLSVEKHSSDSGAASLKNIDSNENLSVGIGGDSDTKQKKGTSSILDAKNPGTPKKERPDPVSIRDV